MSRAPAITVVAFGGNALWPAGSRGGTQDQIAHARLACKPLIARLRAGERMLIVFGNGPQVGAELLRSHAARAEVEPAPLDVCVAATQATIGYLLELALRAERSEAGASRPKLATLASLVLVERRRSGLRSRRTSRSARSIAETRRRGSRPTGRAVLVEDAGRGHRQVPCLRRARNQVSTSARSPRCSTPGTS